MNKTGSLTERHNLVIFSCILKAVIATGWKLVTLVSFIGRIMGTLSFEQLILTN